MQVKVTAERLKRKYAERTRGKRDARNFINENWHKTRESAYRIRHASQSAY